MPCQGRGTESSAPPHPLPGGVLIPPLDPTGLQMISPADVSLWKTFPEPLSQGKQGEALHTHATQTGGDNFPTVQSCIKLEVGRKDADPSLRLPRPSPLCPS